MLSFLWEKLPRVYIEMKYNIEFYEKSNGKSEIWNFLEKLRMKATISKDARIQYKQIKETHTHENME